MSKRSQLKRRKRSKMNYTSMTKKTMTKKKLVNFIKNLTRRTSRSFRKFGRQRGG